MTLTTLTYHGTHRAPTLSHTATREAWSFLVDSGVCDYSGELTDADVYRMIDRYFSGGWNVFYAECVLPLSDVDMVKVAPASLPRFRDQSDAELLASLSDVRTSDARFASVWDELARRERLDAVRRNR